jgi:hypothetical protein
VTLGNGSEPAVSRVRAALPPDLGQPRTGLGQNSDDRVNGDREPGWRDDARRARPVHEDRLRGFARAYELDNDRVAWCDLATGQRDAV